MRIAHISDPHFGRIVSEHVQEDLIRSIHEHDCDAVLVTGDLTQRARRDEFKAARKWIDALPERRLVIPGNHDVHAWWHRPDLRILDPLRRYKKWISADLEQEITTADLAVLGLNTAHGLTIKRGRCTVEQVERIRDFFSGHSPATFKILAVHHPLAAHRDFEALDVACGGGQLLTVAAESGVHMICAGHWHLANQDIYETAGNRLFICLAGTVTSDRWRAPQRGINSWNLVEKSAHKIEVRVYVYNSNERKFELHDSTCSTSSLMAFEGRE